MSVHSGWPPPLAGSRLVTTGMKLTGASWFPALRMRTLSESARTATCNQTVISLVTHSRRGRVQANGGRTPDGAKIAE